NFSLAGEFLWQLHRDGMDIEHSPRKPRLKPQDDYYFSYEERFRPLLSPPKLKQTKFSQVLEWAQQEAAIKSDDEYGSQ
ncbi:MAG: hypothetical protein GQ582_09730, partial [Methyloprofundus sp.]|nr:hypothetical protein [Methyloprofundus sp.]